MSKEEAYSDKFYNFIHTLYDHNFEDTGWGYKDIPSHKEIDNYVMHFLTGESYIFNTCSGKLKVLGEFQPINEVTLVYTEDGYELWIFRNQFNLLKDKLNLKDKTNRKEREEIWKKKQNY